MRTSMIARLALAGTLALATVATVGSPAVAAPDAATPTAAATAGTMTSAVNGTFANGGTVTGSFTPTRFAVRNGELVGTGTLHSVLTDAAGATVGTADTTVTLPVQIPASQAANAAAIVCPVLHLVLGPLDLNLLGLAVHLNTVVLDITAIPGAGNLLGNLLCAVVGLLDGVNLPLGQIAALLNAILALLSL